jgi:SWI/SNF-related matrix-associated actin-dependent regulator 1 of chromatin subfamily A
LAEQVTLVDNHLVLDWPYNHEQVEAVKRIPTAKWDRLARCWKVDAVYLEEVRQFAVKYGLSLHDDVALFAMPANLTGYARLEPATKGGYYLVFPYDPVRVRAAKEVPGAVWDTKKLAWKVPETGLVQALEFAEKFGLDVPAEIREVQASVVARQNRLLALSSACDSDLTVPSLKGDLLPFQRAGVSYAVKARRLLIADQQGLGKTIEALAALEWSAERDLPTFPCLIICPPRLTLNWQYEIQRWVPHRTVRVIKDRKLFPDLDADYTIVGWSNISHWLPSLKKYTSLIFDESHFAKNYTAARTKAAIKIAKSADPKGMLMLLTGTPITNRPAEYASQLEILGRIADFGGRWGLYKRYANAFQDRFGHWHIEGASNLEELNTRLRSAYYLRRTKTEVMPQLAPIRHVRLMVDPDAKLMIEYRQAEADIASYMAARAAELALELGTSPTSAAVRARLKAESAQFLVRIAALRRLAALAKLDAAREWVDDMIENGEKVVIAAHHRDVVNALAAHWNGLKIQGGMSTVEVEAAKKLFQEGTIEDAPVIVLSIQAAATGHTLTAAQNILLLELPWTPADVSQVIARLHRIGQEGSVLATYMLAEGTIDTDIMDMLDQKEQVVNAATEGDAVARDKLGSLLMRFVRRGLDDTRAG